MSLHTGVKGQFGLGTGRAMGKALKKDMFLGKIYRQKRTLLLSGLPAAKKKPPTDMSLWVPPRHGVSGREHCWYEGCYRTHAAYCGCGDFITHLVGLGNRYGFRPGPTQAPGSPSIRGPQPPVPLRRALPAPEPPQANNNNNQRWPGDGGADAGEGGSAASGGGEQLPEDDLDGLLAALDDEE